MTNFNHGFCPTASDSGRAFCVHKDYDYLICKKFFHIFVLSNS